MAMRQLSLFEKQEIMTAVHIPIVAVTAYALEEDREKCIKAGMDAYLAKPVSMESLIKIMSEFCCDNAEGEQ